jgi:hypothetical protein
MRALDQYQKDCWAICFDSFTAGFRKSLGPAFDQDFDNGINVSIRPYDRGISNVMTRLFTCDNAGWFDQDITAVVYNVFKMCASTPACSSLCAGGFNADTEDKGVQELYQQGLDAFDSFTVEQKQANVVPSLVQDFVQLISQVSSLSD